MDNRALESGASASPPSPPATPSMGYPTKGNPATGTPAAKGGEYWFYQIGEELRAILAAAGITPDHTNLTQLLTALRSDGVFQTPAQFDVSAKAATTEFVRRQGMQYSGVLLITGATVLTAADSGKLIWIAGAGGYNITLPSLADFPSGVAFDFYSSAGAACSVVRAGSDTIFVDGTTVTFVSVGIGGTLRISGHPGAAWAANGGSAQLKNSPEFAASLGTTGWRKLPSGEIEQWGVVNFGAFTAGQTQSQAIIFPIAFPSAIYEQSPSHNTANPNLFATSLSSYSLTGMNMNAYSSGISGGLTCYWRARGK